MIENWRKTLFFACLSLVSLIAVQVWYNYASQRIKSHKSNAIGHLVYVEKNVLVKQVKKMLWLPTEKGELVYSGEVIKTKGDSSCEIILDKGDKILLEENSMIVLNTNKDSLDLELVSGDLFLEKKSELNLRSGGKKILISDNSKIKINKEDLETKVQVLEGSVQMKGQEALKGSELIDGKTGITVQKINITDRTPAYGHKYVSFSNKNKINFSWKSNNNRPETVFVVKEGDSKNLKRKALKKRVNLELDPGSYFWEVESGDKKTQKSRLQIVLAKEAKPFLPEDGQVLYINKEDLIDFSLFTGNNLDKTLIKISKNKSLRDSKEYEVKGASSKIHLSRGSYWWKVISKAGEETKESKVFSLEVKRRPSKISITKILPEEKNIIRENGQEVIFSWETGAYKDIYQWEVNIQGKKTLTEKSFIKFKVEKSQQIKVEITAKSREGIVLGTKESVYEIKEIGKVKDIVWVKKENTASSRGNAILLVKNPEVLNSCVIVIGELRADSPCKEFDLKRLHPGVHQVKIEALDQYGRVVKTREPATVEVPNKSSIPAPKLKRVRVGR